MKCFDRVEFELKFIPLMMKFKKQITFYISKLLFQHSHQKTFTLKFQLFIKFTESSSFFFLFLPKINKTLERFSFWLQTISSFWERERILEYVKIFSILFVFQYPGNPNLSGIFGLELTWLYSICNLKFEIHIVW